MGITQRPLVVSRGLSRLLAIAWAFSISGSALGAETPARIFAVPDRLQLAGASSRIQLVVTAEYPDGSLRDVTGEVRYESSEGPLIRLNASGTVAPVSDGDGAIRVSLEGRSVEIPFSVRDAKGIRAPSFREDVVAVLSKAGCNMGACHGNINGKGGFRLSLRGDDPSFDLLGLSRDMLGRRIDRMSPRHSLIFLKPSGGLAHEGGVRFAPDSLEAGLFLGWIAQGARDDLASAAKAVRLSVFPSDRINAYPGRSQQLRVTAEMSDGSLRDVTRLASFDLSDPTAVAISPEGLVTVNDAVEATVAVRYLTDRAVARVAFLPNRPDFVWSERPIRGPFDRAVFKKLKSLKIRPSEIATDPDFLRRAYLDAVGRLPSPEEARAFLSDEDPGKHDKLVDRLVRLPEFADFWALKWADLLRNEEKTMGDKGVWIFQRWLKDRIDADVPLDEFARAIVSAKGSTWTNPPASFYRTNRDPQTAAETVGQVFLGVRLQCARCHNHPFDVWTQNDYYGLAAHFANVNRKILDTSRRDRFDKHEINGDVIVHFDGRPEMIQPRSGEMMRPKPLGAPATYVRNDPNALDDLSDWLTRNNPQFTRNLANRIWFHLLGRGVVEPVDDFRDSNPPSNPELLDELSKSLVDNGMRLKPLVATIMKSSTYRLASLPNETNSADETNFSRAVVRLLPAEVLLDAVGQSLGKPERFTNAPRDMRATQLPLVKSSSSPFLKVFGKPDRLLTCECERSDSTTLAQAFQLINGEAVRSKLESSENRIGRLLGSNARDETILDEIYLATLSRPVKVSERADLLNYVKNARDRRKAWEDVAWALINSKEFLLRH